MSDPTIEDSGVVKVDGVDHSVAVSVEMTQEFMAALNELDAKTDGYVNIDYCSMVVCAVPGLQSSVNLHKTSGGPPMLRVNFHDQDGFAYGASLRYASVSPIGMVNSGNLAGMRRLLQARPVGALAGLILREAVKAQLRDFVVLMDEFGYRMTELDQKGTWRKPLSAEQIAYMESVYREIDLAATAEKPAPAVRNVMRL